MKRLNAITIFAVAIMLMVTPTITKGQQLLPDSIKQKEENLNNLITKKNKTWACFILNNPSTDQWEIIESSPTSLGEAKITLVVHGYMPYKETQTIEKGINKIYINTPTAKGDSLDTFWYSVIIDGKSFYEFRFKMSNGKWTRC
jgi:uncharacterized protein YegP (UPF0339 family)